MKIKCYICSHKNPNVMKTLINRIQEDARCLDGGILVVDRFLNQQMDPELMKQVAVEFFTDETGGRRVLHSFRPCWYQ